VRTLIVAAIPAGAVVNLKPSQDPPLIATVVKVHNSTPEAGKVSWDIEERPGQPIVLSAALVVEVVSLPS